MFKLLALALILQTCSCQYIISNGLGHGRLVTTGAVSSPVLLQTPSYAYSPLTVKAHTPVLLHAGAKEVIAAPRTVVVGEEHGPAEPYNYGYQTTDELGNSVTRQEISDGNGVIRGSYSYVDAQGLNRIVEYVADAAGFRAAVKTNEPGTANANPANVQVSAEAPPAAVVAAYIAPQQKLIRRI